MMRIAIVIFLFVVISSPLLAADKHWVTVDRLNRRTCPDIHCGVVGQLFYREGVTIFEEKEGWARISKYYDASCRDGQSEYVDAGNATCSAPNGIIDGQLAEWVSLMFLAPTRPADPAAGESGIAKVVGNSDDYRKHKAAFVRATEKLIASGRCTLGDFEQSGGWLKSTTTYRNQPVYFSYCGGFTRANRLYLNVDTGEIFR